MHGLQSSNKEEGGAGWGWEREWGWRWGVGVGVAVGRGVVEGKATIYVIRVIHVIQEKNQEMARLQFM